jgi:glyoxalase family protein
VDFFSGVLGLRLVKKTVNFDAPQAYHLYFGDRLGNPGSIMTFFEFRGVDRGRAGAGMVDLVRWRAPEGSFGFWEERLVSAGAQPKYEREELRFEDPEGLQLAIVEDASGDPQHASTTEDIPSERALRGFHSARALVADPRKTEVLMEAIGFERPGEGYSFGIDGRVWYSTQPSAQIGMQGAGTVHHIAWACEPDEQEQWRSLLQSEGVNVTPIMDRMYFRSIYFREPGGVLFEIATKGPGFTVDEGSEELGTSLKLPPQHESLREALERELVPISVPGE